MIILFPMLTSKSINQNSLGGLCKTLEKFVLVYKMDTVLKAAGLLGATIGAKKLATAGMFENENYELSEAGPVGPTIILTPDKIRYREEQARKKEREKKKEDYYERKYGLDVDTAERQRKEFERSHELGKAKYGHQIKKDMAELERQRRLEKYKALDDLGQYFKLDVTFPSTNVISIEPTWVLVSSRGVTQILGIKVIPFYIETDKDILLTMIQDNSLSKADTATTRSSRKLKRILHSILKRIPFVRKGGVISDDVEESILLAKTEHGRNIFLCLNYSDFSETGVIFNAKAITKLFSLGWSSFIAADDVNKRAIFCMKEFKGMCSTVPYAYLYSNISREASKVYDSLDDIKRSASPFFRRMSSTKKIFGEAIAYTKLNKYIKFLNR